MDPARAQSFNLIPADEPPLVIERTDDVWLITDDGRRILDAGGGAVVTNVGHGRPEVIEAAASSLSTIDYVLPIWATEHRVALIEELTQHWLPSGFTRASFFCGGSESIDGAIRLARTHHVSTGQTERWKVIGRDVSYHGSTLSGLSVGHHDRRRAGLEPMLGEHPKTAWLDPYALAKVIEQAGADTVSAFIAEPISGASGGAMVPPDGYLSTIEAVCRDHGILFIVDEVMTGFGRTGRSWGHEHFGVTPDIIVGGKGLSGGYAPMGGLYTTDAIVEPIADAGSSFMYFTFSGADMGCAVSRTVLEIMRREGMVDRAAAMGELLEQRLRAELGDHPHVADIRGRGLLLGLELVADRASGRSFPRSSELALGVAAEALRRGVWVYPCGSGPVDDAILLGPPFTITSEQIDLLVGVLVEAIDVAAARALPTPTSS